MKRKVLALPFIMAIMLNFLFCEILIQPVDCQSPENILIKADGSIDPPTSLISTADNTTYTFTNNINNSIVVQRNNVIIDGNGYTLNGSGSDDGINWSNVNNVTIKNTHIENFLYGISIWFSSNNNISGNIITNCGRGVYLGHNCNFTNISGNNITENEWNDEPGWGDGISLSFSSNNTIVGNRIAANDDNGIVLGHNSNYNHISSNNVTNNRHGVWLGSSSNNTIFGNTITANNDNGFRLALSSNNYICDNNITHNSYGISLSSSSANNFYHNNLIGNTQQIYDFSWDFPSVFPPSSNVWDGNYPSGGNYWSDYTGQDADRDGIGDTPYVIDENNQDNYPLVKPFDSSEHVFNITVALIKFSISISTNSSICEYNFNATSKKLSFKVAGIDGTAGFCNISIPTVLMSGDFTVFKDDTQLVSGVDYTQTLTNNGTYYLFSIEYEHSIHTIKIVSSIVIPDFAEWLVLPFVMITTLLIFVLKKKLKKD